MLLFRNLLLLSVSSVVISMPTSLPISVIRPAYSQDAEIRVPAEALSPIKAAEDQRNPTAPALTDALLSPIPGDRKAAAVAWGRIFRPESVTPLLTLIHDADESVREAAVFSLGQLGWDEKAIAGRETEMISQLTTLLPLSSLPLQALQMQAIAKISHTDPTTTFLPFLSSRKEGLRVAASRACFEYAVSYRNRDAKHLYPVFTDPLIEAFKKLTRDLSPRVRRNATLVLSKTKNPTTRDTLIERLKDRDSLTIQYAIQGLGALADSAAIAPLLTMVNHRDSSVRLQTVIAYQKLKAASQLPEALTKDPSAHVRAAALNAWASDATTPDARLDAFGTDPSPMVRAARITALGKRLSAEKLVALVDQGLKDPNASVRVAAVDQIAGLPNPETRVTPLLQDTDVTVRTQAISVFSELSTPSAEAVVLSTLQTSNDVSTRLVALSILAGKTPPPAPAVLLAASATALDGRWFDFRNEIMNFLAGIKSEEATQALREILKGPSPQIAYGAWKELKQRNVADLPALVEPLPALTAHAKLRFARNPRLVLETNRGQMTVELFPEQAPLHVAQIVGHAENGGYAGTPWHRVVSDFVIQGGDPEHSGWGGAQFPLRAEINPIRFVRGTLGMPRSSEFDSGSVQLFITHVPTPGLDGLYTAFGQLRQGFKVMDAIEPGDRIVSARVIR